MVSDCTDLSYNKLFARPLLTDYLEGSPKGDLLTNPKQDNQMTPAEHIADTDLQAVITKLFNRHLTADPQSTFFLTVPEWNLYNAFVQACDFPSHEGRYGELVLTYNGHPVRAIHI